MEEGMNSKNDFSNSLSDALLYKGVDTFGKCGKLNLVIQVSCQ